ncbi:MAG TPA: HAMP domain-containing protein [Candidatus Nanoarchaeia archaeon]|nr:HAMP domain-containing protein [Candidatus Nanoarchaeia archaeon]
MRIGALIIAGFVLLLAAMTIICHLILSNAFEEAASLQKIADSQTDHLVTTVGNIAPAMSELHIEVERVIEENASTQSIDELLTGFERSVREHTESMERTEYASIEGYYAEAAKELEARAENLSFIAREIIGMRADAASELERSKFHGALSELADEVSEHVAFHAGQLEESGERVLEAYEKYRNYSIISSLSGLMLSLIIAFFATMAISRPLKRLSKSLDEITKGNLGIQLPKSWIGEVNDLANSLNRILASLKLAVMRVGVAKEEIGIGEMIEAKKKAEEKSKKREEQIERFAKLAVGRELKMIELKKRIAELEKKKRK